MDNSHSEQDTQRLKLSDLKKIHKTTEEIADDVSPKPEKQSPPERRKLLRKIWNKLIPTEKNHANELAAAKNEGEIDLLTQIYNNRGFTRRWTEEISRLRRSKQDGQELDAVLLYLDANKLKQINDEKGHEAGDSYLKNLALGLSESIRPTDIVGRIGGDEFAVILLNTTLESTRNLVGTRIKPQLASKGVSVSIGAAPIDPINPDESKLHADEAMYKAKAISHTTFAVVEYQEYGEKIK